MLHNFRVIMKYNPAEAYALAIGHLADRLRGGEPLVQEWPRYERVLSRAERLELQRHLVRQGYHIGEPDGQLGGRTRAAHTITEVAAPSSCAGTSFWAASTRFCMSMPTPAPMIAM